MKNFKKNQVIIFVIALMLVTAGYLNFSNQNMENSLLATSSLADSEQMAAIGDATLVSANQAVTNTTEKNEIQANEQTNTILSENLINVENVISTQEDNYFTQSKLDRESMYSQMLENYQKILETTNLSSEEKASAQKEITRINNEKNAIMIAENLIKTKGFADVVIFMNNGNVTIVIKAEQLNETDISQIQNIVTRELDVEVNKINISCKF